jgi:cation diffusion facilitator family transporter
MFVQRVRILQFSFFAILSSFVVELVFGIISNSLALMADGVHALLDSIVTVVLILAARMATKPPDAEHTYGHGKFEYLGGLFGGIAIFIIAGFFIFESIKRLQSPPPEILPGFFALSAGVYALGVALFRIVLLKRTISKIGGSTLKAEFYHAFLDLGSTVVAIVGIVLVSYGYYRGDFFAALILGILLAYLSVKLIYRTAMDLTDVISPELVNKVKEIVRNTDGVIGIGPILMRKSGEDIFADVTILLRGDVSFEKAHEISTKAENNIKNVISNSRITVHFEPNWKEIPLESKINDVVYSVEGVKGVHNISSYTSEGKIFVSLHVMVDKGIDLEKAHKISELVEEKIHQVFPETSHVTIHLEPFTSIPKNLKVEETITKQEIQSILEDYSEIKNVSSVITLHYKDILKVDIDCSFDKSLSIEKVHDLTSQIERKIRTHYKNAVITIHPEPA